MKLVVLEGPAEHRNYDIGAPRTVIGRAPDCDVRVHDAQVSRHHAQLLRSGDTFFIEGLQQANPVIVNDQFLTGRREVLADGDLIIVGGVLFEVDLPPPTEFVPSGSGTVVGSGGTDVGGSGTVVQPPKVVERRTPRPPPLPPAPPLEQIRTMAARLAAAGQRVQSKATPQPSDNPLREIDMPAVDAILALHEQLGGDTELARLAALLGERTGNQTDMNLLFMLGAEARALVAWTRVAQRSIREASHLAEVLGAR